MLLCSVEGFVSIYHRKHSDFFLILVCLEFPAIISQILITYTGNMRFEKCYDVAMLLFSKAGAISSGHRKSGSGMQRRSEKPFVESDVHISVSGHSKTI